MELRRLRYFIAVAEELHFGRAAERLHMAQPPLSQQVKALEAELGVQLLQRNRRRVELTDSGRLLLEEGSLLLAHAANVEELLRRSGTGEVGRLALGYFGSVTYDLLPAVLQAFRVRFPNIALQLQELSTADQVVALRERKIDIGLVHLPVKDTRIELTLLTMERLIVALPTSHPLTARAQIVAADLGGDSFILFPRRNAPGYYDEILALCRESGFSPNIVYEVANQQAIIALVSAGAGVALVPESTQNLRQPGVVYRPLSLSSNRLSIALAKRQGDSLPVVRNFSDVASAVALSRHMQRPPQPAS
ncbi:MAG: LysR family transcriptional regulator [Gaiellaceae bacterium]